MKNKTTKNRAAVKKRKKSPPIKGDALLNYVVRMTGLPSKDLKLELKEILEKKNINLNQLNIRQLRCVAASYVREIMINLVEKYQLKKTDSLH